MSSRSHNEFLTLLAKDVSCRIVSEIREAEMFSVIADTMPDVSHVDQLSCRSTLSRGKVCGQRRAPQERLVDIKEIHDKTGKAMLNKFFPL